MPKPLRILLVLILLAGAGGAAWYFKPGNSAPRTELVLTGNVEVTESMIGFRIPGRMVGRFKEEGEEVRTGELLARLDDGDQKLAVELAESELATAKATLGDLEQGSRAQEIREAEQTLAAARAARQRGRNELSLAESDFQRFRKLHAEQVISDREFDVYRTTLDTARDRLRELAAAESRAQHALSLTREGYRLGQIEQARTRVETARKVLARARQQLTYTELHAPVSGTVLTTAAEPGEYLAAGTPVLTVADLSRVWIRAYVPEPDLVHVTRGRQVKVIMDGLPDASFTGTVGFINDEAEFTPKTVQTPEERIKLVYRIKVSLANPDRILKAGMPAEVHIDLPAPS